MQFLMCFVSASSVSSTGRQTVPATLRQRHRRGVFGRTMPSPRPRTPLWSSQDDGSGANRWSRPQRGRRWPRTRCIYGPVRRSKGSRSTSTARLV